MNSFKKKYKRRHKKNKIIDPEIEFILTGKYDKDKYTVIDTSGDICFGTIDTNENIHFGSTSRLIRYMSQRLIKKTDLENL